jgi:hypothetical protein
LRTENELLAAVESGGTEVEKTLAERIQFLTSANMIINGQRQSITPPTLATILFVGMLAQKSQASANGPVPQTLNATTSRIYSLLSYSTAHDTLLRGVYATQIRQLLASWIEGIGESNEQYSWSYALQLALRYELREQGPRIARKVLKDPGTNFSSVPYAAFVLGRFGSVEDAVHLEPYLSEEKVFHTWSNTALKKEPIRIEVRDAVLAMLIQLHGENPADYGYKLLQPDDVTIYKVYTLGFLEDAERVAAFAKWKARAAVQPSDSVAEEPGAARSATAAQEGPAQTPGTGG